MASKEALIEALGLKDVTRAGWIRAGVQNPESVASHSWGMALLATQLCPEELNLQRVLELCILHDIAEVHVGDITPHDNVTAEDKHRLESEAIRNMGIDAVEAFAEYEAQQSAESKFVRYPIGGRKTLASDLDFINCTHMYIPNTGYATV